MIPEFLRHATFRYVKASELRPQEGIPSRIAAVLMSQIPAVKDPACLTPEAVILLFAMNPPWVIKNCREYRLILSNNLSPLIGRLSAETEIPVLIMPKQFKHVPETFYQFQLQVALLQKVVYGLDLSTAGPSVFALWRALDNKKLLELSSDLGTKSGVERLTGLDRRTKPQNQTVVTSAFTQIEMLKGVGDE
jgi:hypothetical protein